MSEERSPSAPFIIAEPGSQGAVQINTPPNLNKQEAARYALAAMAYAMFDLVARESVRGQKWARPTMPSGRKRSGTAKSNSMRQRAHKAKTHQLKELVSEPDARQAPSR
ncbi:MAG: hypothetical protein ACYCZ6_17600 [Polaromonas sp.]